MCLLKTHSIGNEKNNTYDTHYNEVNHMLLLALRTVVESQGGISVLANKTGIAPESLSNILSSDEAPRIDTLGTILNALGCRLLIEPVVGPDHCFEPKREDGTDVNSAVEKDIEQVVEPHLS